MILWNKYMDELIRLAFKEDLGDGDHTTLACIPDHAKGKVQLLVKQEGILAGVEVAQNIFKIIDDSLSFEKNLTDGTHVAPGDIAFFVSGKVHSLLQSERIVLNLMQRMSGIASQTYLYVKQLEGLNTRVIDTRKTAPGLRHFDKMAVVTGGGYNHRFGLYDMILIKDNHIDFSGGIENAIKMANQYLIKKGAKLKVEIEARSLPDVETIMHIGSVDRILLDNFSPEDTAIAVKKISGQYETESSGNITLENIRKYGETGVDFISVGALTHHVSGLDLSLKAIDF